eukprot:m.284522 g.284522  ORF g.284522 m.284522 type:complete len:410 (+) comp27020_c1_seq1:101-1330(+)
MSAKPKGGGAPAPNPKPKLTYKQRLARIQNPDGTLKFLPKSEWVPDKAAKACMQCKAKFSRMGHRKHHCRMCGSVVCQQCTSRRHPKYEDNRVCFGCYSMIMIADNKLQQAGWYHGPMSRQSSELRLKSGGTRQGDFLVRESASVDGFIALSIKGKDRIVHFLINEKYGRFFIGPEPTTENKNVYFATIQNLITENKAKYNLKRAMVVPSFSGSTCPGCAATVGKDDEFCDECGRRLKSTAAQIQTYEDADVDADEGDVTYADEFDASTEARGYVPPASPAGAAAAPYPPGGAAPPAAYGQPQHGGAPPPQAYGQQGGQPAPNGQPWQQGGAPQPAAYGQPQQGGQPAAYGQPQSAPAPTAYAPPPQAAPPPQVQSIPPPAPAAKFCGGCGSKRQSAEKFCGNCGKNLT